MKDRSPEAAWAAGEINTYTGSWIMVVAIDLHHKTVFGAKKDDDQEWYLVITE